jgi:gliding motility-associated-like protein
MKKTLLSFTCLAALLFANKLKAQLTTTQTLTPQQLVQNVLLGGGVTASNITFSGSTLAIAQFTASSSTNLGISSGVVMSSGNTTGANGISGNVSGVASTIHNLPGDTDLNSIIPNTEDACILEFDFVPLGDTLSFNYVFGSDEYPFYVCSNYADVFAYLVSGPNPLGGLYNKINIATIPGTTLPVSINSINSGSPGGGYPSSGCLSTAYSSLFVNNQSPVNTHIKYNGMSIVLRAKLPVICGQTYHIKMGIADVFDGSLDSGVFLEGGSFSSLPPLNLNTTNANSLIPDSILVEDCNTNCINFIRNGNIANADSFSLQVGGNALLGIDYIQAGNPGFTWPTTIYFAANQDTLKFCNLTALQDGLTEGLDTIKFTMSSFITSSVSCLSSNSIKYNLYVKDYTPISIAQNDVTLCTGTSTILNAGASGGYPAYSYSISAPSVTTATLNTGPITAATIFTITVNDICNKPITKQITVTPVAIPTVTVNDTTLCAGNVGLLYAGGAATYSWSSGATTSTINVTPTVTTNYTVVGSVGTCSNSAVSAVNVIGQAITITGNNNICIGQNSTLTASGSAAYTWDNGITTNTIVVAPMVNTTYTVTSVAGTCTNMAVYTVSVSPIPTINITGSVTCPGQNTTLTASGGTFYSWSTGSLTNTTTVNPLVNTTYSVTGILAACTNTAAYTVTVIPTPSISVTPPNPLICAGNSAVLSASGASSYTWSTGSTSFSTTVNPASTANYTVVGSVGSCTASTIVTVTVSGQPITITGNNTICIGQSTTLSASGGALYSWSNGASGPSISVTPTTTTIYTVTSIIGTCTNTAIDTVIVTLPPTLTVTGTPYCAGQTTTITASGATSYTWSSGSTTNSIVVSPIGNPSYTVTASSIPSCTSSTVFTLSLITGSPQIINTSPVIYCLDSTKAITVRAIGGNQPYNISWLIPIGGSIPFDTLNNTFYFPQTTTQSSLSYTIIVTDQCLYADTLAIDINSVDCSIIIPNVVTPNGDGINDFFRINGLENFPGSTLTVFNRWGNKIYNSDNYNNDWAPDVNDGTYFYVINLSDGRKFSGFFEVFKK